MVEFCAEVAPHRNSQTGLPRWVNSEPKTLYSPKSRKKADVKMRATAMASEPNTKRPNSGLAPGPVISDVLLERVQFMAEIVDALLQQVADGEHAQ